MTKPHKKETIVTKTSEAKITKSKRKAFRRECTIREMRVIKQLLHERIDETDRRLDIVLTTVLEIANGVTLLLNSKVDPRANKVDPRAKTAEEEEK